MGHKKQYQNKIKQALKRKKKRAKLAAKGANLTDYYYGKFFLKSGE